MAEGKLSHVEMVRIIAERTQIAQKYVREVLDAAVGLIKQELLVGRQIKVNNLGTFKPQVRKARTYAAPLTEKPVKKGDTISARFKQTAEFKRQLNGQV
jgi:nucleoid DNA-binding protein